MQLFVETNDLREAEKLAALPFVNGLCLNSERLKGYGNGSVESDLIKLAATGTQLIIDLNGDSWEEWISEAIRIQAAGFPENSVVFRMPATAGALQATKELEQRGMQACIRFVNTLQQGYLALQAGAAIVSIPYLEMADKGTEPVFLASELLEFSDLHAYNARIMLSQVTDGLRLSEAMRCGVDLISVSASLAFGLQQNLLDNRAANEYVHESRLHVVTAADVMRREHISVTLEDTVTDATAKMTLGGLGAVAVQDGSGKLCGVFTDGDLRRQLQAKGKEFLQMKMSDMQYKTPVTIQAGSTLAEASSIFREKRIDNILVVDANKLVGIIDIQDLNL
ncbi:MAG: CBS domain-containing protein [Bacteroidetes bacterium]|nr:CBS domain-containing protein [Bacteroidota bacterium]